MNACTIFSLWRYPVKSMAGEEVNAVDVTATGLRGDRAYALVDTANGKVGSAKSVKKFGQLLKCQAQFVTEPGSDGIVPPVRIKLPDGTSLDSAQPDSQATLAAAFGPEVSLRSTAPDGLMLEFAAGTLGGKYAETTEVPVAGAAPRGTLFDYACIHILTISTLRRLQEAYPEGQFSVQRFRPNIVVDCVGESGFVENSWVSHSLAIGPELILRVSKPCARCVMTTLPRVDLPHDPRILRTAVQLNMQNLGDFGNLPCVGVYADVVNPGRIRCGDPVRVID
jgi:hypothetical protein